MYLVKKKKAKTAHIWNGHDTACRMYSTNGLRKKAFEVLSKTDLPICIMCENKAAIAPKPMKDESERPAPFQHFKDEAERQQHLKEVREAQEAGAPF